ncbi:MAG: VWA domain-containing protein [bacterium]|nr:VWA domain-containing protein [bacterium]
MFRFISTHLEQFTGNTKARVSVLVVLVLATTLLAHAKSLPTHTPPIDGGGITAPAPPATGQPNERPRIDVVFALDTTGSMSGLIDGAKQKIWSIVNQMANANTTPEIRIGLIGYRDRGDQYITTRFDLTDDIDALYGNLQSLSAGGGGDGPESVNQALHEAVTLMSWTQDPQAYKVVFVVGDAPPHMDYQGEVQYPQSVRVAMDHGIVVNTIQCGNMPETASVFAGIAKLSHGEYANISQDGAMVASHTPMDEELATLNRALAETVVAYGAEPEKEELLTKVKRSLAAAPSAVASRLSYFSKKGGVTNSGRADLVDALSVGEIDLDSVPVEELSSEMQAMEAHERARYVEKKSQERSEIKVKIAELAQLRDEYIESDARKREAEGKADAFDDRLLETVRTQAAKKGIAY